MRGIGKGQTIHLFIVPEIKKLIKKTLPRVTGHVEDDVAAWLQLNNMKIEKLQFLQLCCCICHSTINSSDFDSIIAPCIGDTTCIMLPAIPQGLLLSPLQA